MAGTVGADVRKAVGQFFKNKLKLEATFLTPMGEIGVETVPFTSRSKIKGEAIVSFSTVEIRDIVKRAARELAGCPDAGIRLEVPQHLQSSLKALEAVSYAPKQKNPGMRRNVWYDDSTVDLMLDFCLDPSELEPQWKKIHPDQSVIVRAKTASRSRSTEELISTDLDSLLGLQTP